MNRAAVVGPTASGKSSVAMAAARELGDVELVSVDSMQVYRGMDIGTAKPSVVELSEIRHHLIDLIEPTQPFAVAEFQRSARQVLDDVARRGRRALLVGGTGLYHRAVIDDLDIPGEWPSIRARVLDEIDALGAEAAHDRLRGLDPVAADRMEPTNVRRIARALEVIEGSGRSFSSFGPGLDHFPPTPIAQVGVRWERGVLARRIEARVHEMMELGWLAEVERLAAFDLSPTARQALGYRELLAHLDGEKSLDEAVELTIVRTRQFAVRQLRWFQRDPRVRWVDVENDPVAEALPAVLDALAP